MNETNRSLFRPPTWDSHAFDRLVSRKGYTIPEVARRIQPLVGHIPGTKEASVLAFHAQGREPSKYAIVCALAHVLECTPDDFFRR
jgi:hypothetical protein